MNAGEDTRKRGPGEGMTTRIGSLRQACLGCGGSCHGVNVRAVDADEQARIDTFAVALGVNAPWLDGRLRRNADDGCVFLDAFQRCRIHATYGSDAKPVICRQYPLVAVDVGGELRLGVDPGCYRHAETWRSAEPLEAGRLRAQRILLEGDDVQAEAALLALCDAPGQTVAGALGALIGRDPSTPAFVAATVRQLHAADLRRVLAGAGYGGVWRASLMPVLDGVGRWVVSAPPAVVLSAEEEAYALDAVRRAIGLRLLHHVGSPPAAAFLMLVGALVCAWATGGGPAYGSSLAGWTRALRSPPFQRALLPEPSSLARWLNA